MSGISLATVEADGVKVFYREAGEKTRPVLLLLHGFPSSSHMFRNLIPLLAKSYRVIAPDFPGFGFTEVPEARKYEYSFASLAKTVEAFVDALGLTRFAVYIFDYGAPVGLRLALARPELVAAIVSQNGNAYVEGLGGSWAPIQQYWATGTPEDRAALNPALTLEATRSQYVDGSPHPERIEPEAYYLDQALLDRPGIKEIQLDLFYDYRNNVAIYPQFHEYFRSSGVPVLAVWGTNDGFFTPPGAEAYARDVKTFELHFLDASHFALETNEVEIAGYIDGFLTKNKIF
ncbi:Alpha/Beta hydrolase protein [Xylariales sp. PMI_506]|nr:Alpha/Beta hydrolase protein [Xylariales sp. PMI_506]